MAPEPARPSPRSLADEMRGWDDADLARLLAERGDLAVPPPPDLTALAARAAGRAGVRRAMDRLDTAALQVLEVLAVLPEPTSAEAVADGWGRPATHPLRRLRSLALVWGPPDALRLVRAARELAGPHPAGLGPPLAEALGRRSPSRLADLVADLGLPASGDPETALTRLSAHLARPEVIQALLATAPDGARRVLEHLTWGPPAGSVDRADRPVRGADAVTPVDWLLAHGLLAVADPGHVVLPREIGLALREGRVQRDPSPQPPPLGGRPRAPQTVSGTATGAAAEAVRLVEALGAAWEASPPPVLRAGGLGMRELRRLALGLGVDDRTAGLLVEVAHEAGLVASDGEADPRWAPTAAYDAWLGEGTGWRWASLAVAWLTTSRVPALVGSRDGRGTVRVALGADLDRPLAPAVRAGLLAELAAPGTPGGDGACWAGDAGALRDRLNWSSPRLAGSLRDALVDWTLEEAAILGVTGAGALSTHGRALLPDATRPPAPDAAAEALDAALPEPVEHVLLQADLTAVVPGPPTAALAAELDLVADVESRGGATVYRFSAASVQRALDAGHDAATVLDLLTVRSRTGVPQPLEYLVRDAARRHGRLRIGTGGAYLRSDDASLLAELLADRRAAGLGLRRLAPTVLVARADPEQVARAVRAMGLAPSAEAADGTPLLHLPRRYRAVGGPRRSVPRPPQPSPAALLAAVRALRAADRRPEQESPEQEAPEQEAPPAPAGKAADGESPRRRRPPRVPVTPLDPATALAALRAAADTRAPVWIRYVEADGVTSHRLLEPVDVVGGLVHADDGSSTQRIPIHRITHVTAPNGQN